MVGAQAVYLHTGSAGIAIAPFTTDGDLALDPTLLADDPKLEEAMRRAGFALHAPNGHEEPGTWIGTATIASTRYAIPVDLIVPEGIALEGGRRGARLKVHGNRAARRAVGLEAALVDHGPMEVGSLDPADARTITVEVAGIPALLVAKAHKIHDRLNDRRGTRVVDKDAADVFRMMQVANVGEVAAALAALMEDVIAGEVTQVAIEYLVELFIRPGSPGVLMASQALQLEVPRERIAAVANGFAYQLRASTP